MSSNAGIKESRLKVGYIPALHPYDFARQDRPPVDLNRLAYQSLNQENTWKRTFEDEVEGRETREYILTELLDEAGIIALDIRLTDQKLDSTVKKQNQIVIADRENLQQAVTTILELTKGHAVVAEYKQGLQIAAMRQEL